MAYFLKHLTEETMALKKLLIPPEFVSNCGRLNLTNPVVLEPTVGDLPEVELELYEDGRGFWLRNGWQEFADRYSLTHGHYLLFEYKSFSRFKLVMFGANGVDVMCPAPRFHNVASNRNNQDFVEAEQEEETRGSPPVAGGGGRQPARPRSAENAKQKAFMSSRKGRTADGGQRDKRNQFGRDKAETSHIPAMAEHAEGMPKPGRGNTSTSSVCPSFFITIKQTCMKHGYAYLPTDFVFRHMKLENSTVMVYSEDGTGAWLLSFVFNQRSKSERGRGRGIFCGGWSAFCEDNSLKSGDVCRFKLISRDEMEVTIQRN